MKGSAIVLRELTMLSLVLIAMAFGLNPIALFGQEGAEEPPKDGPAVPEFKQAKGQEAFQKGKGLFDAGKYREAQAEIKKSKESAKTSEDKEVVERWVSACDGGTALDLYKKSVERGALRQTYFQAAGTKERYEGTAIEEKFKVFLDDLATKVFEVLEDFDRRSERYSAKYGKEFVSDKAIVHRGANCLKWSSTKDGKVSQLQIANVPKNWSGYHSVAFWIRCERPVELYVYIKSPTPKGPGETNAMESSYSPVTGKGWTLAELELDKFKKRGQGSLANVEELILHIEGRTTFKIYLDDIVLVRKDKSGSGAATDKEEPADPKKKPAKAKKAAKKAKGSDPKQ